MTARGSKWLAGWGADLGPGTTIQLLGDRSLSVADDVLALSGHLTRVSRNSLEFFGGLTQIPQGVVMGVWDKC